MFWGRGGQQSPPKPPPAHEGLACSSGSPFREPNQPPPKRSLQNPHNSLCHTTESSCVSPPPPRNASKAAPGKGPCSPPHCLRPPCGGPREGHWSGLHQAPPSWRPLRPPDMPHACLPRDDVLLAFSHTLGKGSRPAIPWARASPERPCGVREDAGGGGGKVSLAQVETNIH